MGMPFADFDTEEFDSFGLLEKNLISNYLEAQEVEGARNLSFNYHL